MKAAIAIALLASLGACDGKKKNTVSGVGQIRSDEGKLVLEVAARVAIAERELIARAIAAVLPAWLEEHYDLTPKAPRKES